MASLYTEGKEIVINMSKKPFAAGSEGQLYIVDGKVYKIYFSNALNEGFGDKKRYHQALLQVKDLVNHFVLPESLLFDDDGRYVGYVTDLVDRSRQKEGATSLAWDSFVSNIKNLEIETNILSDNRFLLVDLGFHNSLFSQKDGKLYMTDPGRYHRKSLFTVSDYKRRNQLMLTDYFRHMLERDIIYFKLVNKSKTNVLVSSIVQEIGDRRYSDYFENVSSDFESVHEFLSTKGKFIK